MASMGSLSTESSLLVLSQNRGRPRLSFFAFRLKNPDNSTDLTSSAPKHLRVVRKDVSDGVLCCERLNSLFGATRARIIRPMKASGGVSAKGGDGEEPEDVLQATIEKSKKVLAVQKDLLDQIAERRKLVSSIKNSIVDLKVGVDSHVEKKSPFPSLDPTADPSGVRKDIDTGGNFSRGNANSVEGGASKPTVTNEDSRVPEKKPSHNASFDVNSHNQLRDTASGTGRTDEVPAVLSSSSGASNLKGKKHDDLTQSSIKEIDERRIDPQNDQHSYREIKFSNQPTSSGDVSSNEANNSNIQSSSDTDLPLGSSRKAHEQASSNAESGRQLKDAPSGRLWSDFLSGSAGTSSQKDQVHYNLEQSSKEEVHNEENKAAIEDEKPPPLAGPNVMNVILVAAECAPWSKTGGLGDVAGALPKALAKRGHRVMVVAPQYSNYDGLQNTGVRKIYKVDGQDMEVHYSQTYIDGVDFVFIENSMFRNMQNDIYGGNRMDVLRRMVLFCKAAVEVPWHVPCGGVCYGDGNLVFIANDWHTALLPVYLKAYYRDHGLMQYTRSILVIHNIAHQGRGPVDDFKYAGLPSHYLDHFRMFDPIGGEHLNIFAAGLKAADRIITVSQAYSWELKTSEGGWGLSGIINENHWKLMGIVNGIDTKEWNPQVDIHLKSDGYTNYSVENFQSGKAQCKEALQRELGLPVRNNVPLIGFIGRLDHQKGIDLIADAIPWMMDQDVQLVMLGTGRKDLEDMLKHFESQYHDKVRGWVGFSVKTAHRITAGADILLMPSRFEPCGLNQLYAMNYGTVPVVHAVGGLRDTVQPFDPYNESGLGWTFDRAETDKLIHALGNCLLTYREYRYSWEGIQRRGMMQDLSWDNAAEKYEEALVAAKYTW